MSLIFLGCLATNINTDQTHLRVAYTLQKQGLGWHAMQMNKSMNSREDDILTSGRKKQGLTRAKYTFHISINNFHGTYFYPNQRSKIVVVIRKQLNPLK